MNYIVFPHKAWMEFPYKRLLQLLPERDSVTFIGAVPPGVEGITGWSIGEPERWENAPRPAVALVFSAIWLDTVLQLKPRHMVAVFEADAAAGPADTPDSYKGLLAASADLIASPSERLTMEHCLQGRPAVLLWTEERHTCGVWEHGEELLFLREDELTWLEALQAMLQEGRQTDWLVRQWKRRLDYYSKLYDKLDHHETAGYMLASYHYFVNEEEAAKPLTESYERMLMKGHTDCLRSHYRFFSAIEAKSGHTGKALRTFEITALTPEERGGYEQAAAWLSEGKIRLVHAAIYYWNEDYGAAMKELEEAGIEEREAAGLLLACYLRTSRLRDAWELAAAWGDLYGMLPGLGIQGPAVETLEGLALWLGGDPYGACRHFLGAYTDEMEDLPIFREWAELIRRRQLLAEEVNHVSADMDGAR